MLRNAHLWLPGYLRSRIAARRRRTPPTTTLDVLLCIADHYEPRAGHPGMAVERARVARWVRELPRFAQFRDADGRPPQHTFFFPQEEYEREHLDALAGLCARGFGEVEIHLHHDRDSALSLHGKLTRFRDTLARDHGLLGTENGRSVYSFIHGNYALDDARPDGRWCGVANELDVLVETGCVGDFTLPCAPNPCQTRIVNEIYYARENGQRRSHDRGVPVRVGGTRPARSLLMIQGPLALDWSRKKHGFLPGIENSELGDFNRPTAARLALGVRTGVSVAGRPEWIFVKLHTHGGPERNANVLLGEAMARFHTEALARFNDGSRFRLHYVTAREMVNIAAAAEAGERGNAGAFRDYRIAAPAVAAVTAPRSRASSR